MRRVGGGGGGGCGGFQKCLHQSKAASNLLQSGGLFIRFRPGSDHLIDAPLSLQAGPGSATELRRGRLHAFDIMHCDLAGMSPFERRQQQQQGEISAIAPAAAASALHVFFTLWM